MTSFEKILTNVLDFNLEKINPLYKGFLLVSFFVVFVCISIYSSNEARISRERYKEMLKDEFSGIVARKYLDKESRNSPVFKLKDSSWHIGYNMLWEKIEIGDSLSKKGKSPLVKIIKKGTIEVFDVYYEFKNVDTININK
ncbi:hypothetical protein [Flavobacterium sp. PL02]|uniref:hypothetical protein n=1 Tax=Flavobacterium sp. PL02 TaxID=3088354 RepID=UPI002B224F1E|nr:hypothetical protein [Flavobacterium sp. PL02]MEA9413654.1 hypothetical protein [Flavobacterium sp. PL02]